MKTFWVVIVVVVGLAAGAFLLRGGRAPKAIPIGEPTRIVMEDPRPAPPAPKQVEPAAAKPEPTKPEPVKPEAVKTEPAPAPVAAPPAPVESKPPALTATAPEAGPAEAKPAEPSLAPPEPVPAPQPKASEQPKPVEAPKPVVPPAAPGQATPAPQTSEPLIPPAPAEVKSEPPSAPAPAPAPAAKPSDAAPPSDGPPVIEKREDGSMLVDGKYEVKGDGSAEKPYEVTWEMLISAQETYQPKEGKKLIPGRLAMLDNKHVRVTGYIAFPLYVQEAREMLSMLNQWDGCCIGVPPTPYDAIEVRLKDAVTGPDRFATFGSVEGRFGVKPYVVGDWLVGLYTLDDAKFDAKVFSGS